jgi:threonine/homoserine/homoserine lactone efflux protein
VSTAFLLTSLAVVVSPGTGVLYTLSAGLSRGRRASVVAAFGCTLGIVPHMAAAIVGLAALLYASSTAFEALKFAGVAYLLYLAWRTLREHGVLTVDSRPARHVVLRAIAVNFLNPKLSIFFFAFLPQFATRPLDMLELSAVFMLLTFAVFVAYGLLAAAVRRHVLARPRVLTWLRRSFAAAFVGLGVKLALAER